MHAGARLSMAIATAFRRKLFVVILLGLALAGAAIRTWADNPSGLHDIGTLLLVMWVPAIGNVVGYFGRKIRLPAPRLAFDVGSPLAAHVLVEFTPLVPQPPQPTGPEDAPEDLFTLVIGREGFSARPAGPLATHLESPAAQRIELEFLHPVRAAHRFPVGTAFTMLVGKLAVGRGTVLQTLPTPVR